MMINYFELFEIEQRYDLDLQNLKKKYLKLQSKFHPDRASNLIEETDNLNISMQINEGYKILSDDYSRAEHILKLANISFDEKDLKNIIPNSDLVNYMEYYERIDEEQILLELIEIEKEIFKAIEDCKIDLIKSLEGNDMRKALEFTLNIKYLTNLLGNTKEKMRIQKRRSKNADN